MDVKGVVKTLIPNQGIQRKEPVEKAIRSENTNEREGNGQASNGSGQQQGQMSDEQFQRALEHIKNHSVVKDNNLEVSIEGEEGKRFIILAEPNGKIVRRIPEAELWSLQFAKEGDKGQLMSRAA